MDPHKTTWLTNLLTYLIVLTAFQLDHFHNNMHGEKQSKKRKKKKVWKHQYIQTKPKHVSRNSLLNEYAKKDFNY